MGRLISETNPESGTKTFVYDSDSTMCGAGAYSSSGDLVKTVDAAGNCENIYYDPLHRLTDEGAVQYCKRFRYDNTTGVLGTIPSGVSVSNTLGRLVEVETDTCAWPIIQSSIITDEWTSYTVRGQPSDLYESTPHSGTYYHINETYWANGVLYQLGNNIMTLPTFTYSPDGEGRLYQASASAGQNPVTGTSFNSASLPTAITYGSSDSDSYSYDSNTDRVTQYQFNVNSQSLTGALTWNANHTLSALNITDAFNSADTQSCSFSHDDLTRLVTANCGSVWSQTFSYDPFGNLSSSGSMSFQPTYSVSTNQITSVGGFTPTYDANGDTTADPSNTYTWNADGQPLSISGVNLTHDALGRMVEQNRSGAYTQIVYGPNGGKFALMSGSTLQKAIVPLPGGSQAVYNSSGLLYYGHSDHLGSVRVGSSLARSVVFDMAYAPFGETYATSGSTDSAFTTERQDTVANIYDFPAREYNNFGRWPSPDPSGLAAVQPDDPQTLNRYAYVRNNPLGLIDPSGLAQQCENGCPQQAPGPAMCLSSECSFGGFSWFPDAEMGYDIFDAIEGAAGTYISYDIYGRMSFGWSFDLYKTTLQLVDALNQAQNSGPPCPGCVISVNNVSIMFPAGDSQFSTSSGWQVIQMNLGTDTVTSGIVPDLISAVDYGTWLSNAFPKNSPDASGYLQVFQNMYFGAMGELCGANAFSCQNLAGDIANAVGPPAAPFPINQLPFPSPVPPPPKPN